MGVIWWNDGDHFAAKEALFLSGRHCGSVSNMELGSEGGMANCLARSRAESEPKTGDEDSGGVTRGGFSTTFHGDACMRMRTSAP